MNLIQDMRGTFKTLIFLSFLITIVLASVPEPIVRAEIQKYEFDEASRDISNANFGLKVGCWLLKYISLLLFRTSNELNGLSDTITKLRSINPNEALLESSQLISKQLKLHPQLMITLECAQLCNNCTIDQVHRVSACNVCDYCRKKLSHPDSFTEHLFEFHIFRKVPRRTGSVGHFRYRFENAFEMATRNDASLLDHSKIPSFTTTGIGNLCFRKRWCNNTLHIFDTLNIVYMNETCPIRELNDTFLLLNQR